MLQKLIQPVRAATQQHMKKVGVFIMLPRRDATPSQSIYTPVFHQLVVLAVTGAFILEPMIYTPVPGYSRLTQD